MLSDPALAGADLRAIGHALAALLAREPADLYLTCSWSGDIDGTLPWVGAAELLKLPVLTQSRRLQFANNEVVTARQTEGGDVTLAAPLPCLVEVTETINEPRYPTIKGKAAARSKPITILRLSDLGLPSVVAAVGSKVVSLSERPQRRRPIVIEDRTRAPQQVVEFLETRKLIR